MLPTQSPILCAIDLSDGSDAVLAHAVALARALGAAIHVVHAVEPLNQTGRAMLANVLGESEFHHHEDVARQQREQLFEDRLRAFADKHLDGIAHRDVFAAWHLEAGRPAKAVLETAQRLGAAMIVAGRQGHSALEHLMVGSVAQQLLHDANLPILLVPLAHGGR